MGERRPGAVLADTAAVQDEDFVRALQELVVLPLPVEGRRFGELGAGQILGARPAPEPHGSDADDHQHRQDGDADGATVGEKPILDTDPSDDQRIFALPGLVSGECVVEDGASDWPTFAEKAQKLISTDDVAATFGGWTSASRISTADGHRSTKPATSPSSPPTTAVTSTVQAPMKSARRAP